MPKRNSEGILWNKFQKTPMTFDGKPSYYRTGKDKEGNAIAEARIGDRWPLRSRKHYKR